MKQTIKNCATSALENYSTNEFSELLMDAIDEISAASNVPTAIIKNKHCSS